MYDGSPFATCDECGFGLWRGRCHRDRCSLNSSRWVGRQARRIRINLSVCTGELLMLTITGPGGAWSEFDVWQWNVTCWSRFQRLRDLAGKQASREVPGVSSRLVAWVPELQPRGLLHFHLVFEASTVLEKRWAERYYRYLRKHVVEHGFGPQTAKGKWSRSQVGRYVSKLASYLTKDGSPLLELWHEGKGAMPGRCFYVSRRLMAESGCTIRLLRRSARLWACERLSVPSTAFADWTGFERALGRSLTRLELLSLQGVTVRGPPPLGAAVEGDSARQQRQKAGGDDQGTTEEVRTRQVAA